MKNKRSQEDHKIRGTGFIPIGIVSALVGYVAIKGTDGFEKLLKLGDQLFSNDEVLTGQDGHAVIDLADGSSIELNPDSALVLDEDVIDAALLASIAPSGGEQSDGGFGFTRMDIQEQDQAGSDLQAESNPDALLDVMLPGYIPGDTGTGSSGSDDDNGAGIPGDNPEPPEHPVGTVPSLSIADVVVIEPPPAGSQGQQGGGHETGEDGGDEHADSGHESDTGGHESDTGHDTGDDTHDSGSDHDGGHGEATPVYAVFTLVLSAPALTDVSVDFSTANGTAIAGGRGVNENDYGQTRGTLTIPRGETSGTIQVEIFGDRGVEPDNEYFYLNLDNPHGATLADNQATASIIDSGHGEGSLGEGDIITGTAGDDVLTGTGGRDTIYGEDGDDTLSGRGGPDTLFGGAGDDLMQGMGGPDTMSGGEGNDTLYGQGGRDVMDGGAGDDVLDGGGSPDTLIGGEGNDLLYGGGGPDLLQGGPGNDTLQGGPGSDILEGGPGNDILVGGESGDIFRFDSFDAVDSVIDFNPVQGDVIDISALLEDFNPADPISHYVQLQQAGDTDNYELLVNPVGSGADNFQLLVTLENFQYTTSVDDLVDNGNLIVSDLV